MSGNPRPRIERIRSEDCLGPLIWYEVPLATNVQGAVLQCSVCGAIFTTGGFLDAEHEHAELLREGMAA